MGYLLRSRRYRSMIHQREEKRRKESNTCLDKVISDANDYD